MTTDQHVSVNDAASTRSMASPAPPPASAPAPGPASSQSRRRGHRALSAVWSFLTEDARPHHSTSSQCMHCRQPIPHHRKSEKARAHLNRCAPFRVKMARLPADERPTWVDFSRRTRGRCVPPVTSTASAPATSPAATSLPMTAVSSTPPGSSTTPEVDMLAESLMDEEPQISDAASDVYAEDDETRRSRRVDGDKNRFHSSIAMHFYVTDAAPADVAEPNLTAAFRHAGASLPLPTPEDLGGSLLNNAFQRTQSLVDAGLQLSQFNCISLNSWWRPGDGADGATRTINYVAANEDQTFYLESQRVTKDQLEDEDFATNEMLRLMERCHQRVCGAVTDNTRAQQGMWRRLKAIHPGQFFHGCMSHGLSLFIQDIFDRPAVPESPQTQPSRPFADLQSLTEDCRVVATFFQQDADSGEALRLASSSESGSLAFPLRNQWAELRSGFLSFLTHEPGLRAVMSDPLFVSESPQYMREYRVHVMQIVLDVEFVPSIEKALKLLEPLTTALKHFDDAADASCSDVFACFAKTLPDAFNGIPDLTDAERSHLLAVNQRRFNFMYGDGHGIAYLLDPRFIGDGLSVQVRKNVEDTIYGFPVGDEATEAVAEELKLEMAQQLTEFVIDATRERAHQTFRFSLLAKRKKSPLQYWLTDGQRWPRLQQVACRVFCLPSSTVSLERKICELAPRAGPSSASSETADKIKFVRINTLLQRKSPSLG